jgi:hypothetical protein
MQYIRIYTTFYCLAKGKKDNSVFNISKRKRQKMQPSLRVIKTLDSSATFFPGVQLQNWLVRNSVSSNSLTS